MLRRHLLALLTATPVLALAGAGSPAQAASSLLALPADPAAMRRVGLAYLAVSGERSAEMIDAALRQRLGAAGEHRDPNGLEHAVTRAIREDFAASRTVLVDGWLLAETECRLCALTALAA